MAKLTRQAGLQKQALVWTRSVVTCWPVKVQEGNVYGQLEV